MSIASRIESMTTHLQNDYDALESVVGTITEDKNIENIAPILDNLWEELPHTTGTGTSLSLATKAGKMKVNLLGNTSQYTTTGKNLVNTLTTNPYIVESGLTYSRAENGELTITGTSNRAYDYNLTNTMTFEAGKTYTFSTQNSGSTDSYIYIQFNSNNGGTKTIKNTGTLTFTIVENQTLSVKISLGSGASVNWKFKIMVEEGSTAHTYEPYTGGIPSPNPSYPQDIHIVSGDNEIVVCGKNICDIVLDNTVTGSVAYKTYSLQPSTQYTVSTNTWVTSTSTANIFASAGTSFSPSSATNGVNGSRTVTSDSNGKVTIGYRNVNNSMDYASGAYYVQLEKGSQATNYEPYTSTSYTIHLGTYELCKISTYQDSFFKAVTGNSIYDNLDSATKESLTYGEWYLEKKIGKVVLDGSENWQSASSVVSGTSRFYYDNNEMLNPASTNTPLSNMFKSLTWTEIYSQDTTTRYGVAAWDDASRQGRLIIRIDNTLANSVSAFKTWLGTHNTPVYFPYATPKYTPITGTLKDELESAWRANSYKDTTNISQVNNDLPFNLDITALEG